MPEQTALTVRPSLRLTLEIMLFAVLPGLVYLVFLSDAYHQDILGYDFTHFLLPPARNIAAGGSPYPGYEYPPLVYFSLVPFVWIPGPNVVFAVILTACVPASLWFLGVRDWRCYGIVFGWVSVMAAVQTSNVTIPLLLGTAICWKYRDRWKIASVSGGLTIAAKLLTAPMVVWLVATRRIAAAVGVLVVAGGVSLFLWSLLGFSGLNGYQSRMGAIEKTSTLESYTFKVVLQDAGLGDRPAQIGWALVALAVVAAAVILGWRGDDERSFALACAAMIVAIPIVWMHSFALLIAPVAVMRPRLSAAWFVPVLFLIGSGNGNGDPWQTAGVLAVMAVTLLLALLPPRRQPYRRARVSTELASDSSAV